jgi:putative transposase
VIYTTNAIDSLNYSLRKIIKTRRHFPSEEAATKLLYLALVRAEQRWTMPIWRWKDALNQFAVHFGQTPGDLKDDEIIVQNERESRKTKSVEASEIAALPAMDSHSAGRSIPAVSTALLLMIPDDRQVPISE